MKTVKTLETQEFNERLGERLRIIRLAKGLTQNDASKVIGMTRCTVANIEKGRQNVYLHSLVKFCEAYGITLQDLIDDNFEYNPNTGYAKVIVKQREKIRELEYRVSVLEAFARKIKKLVECYSF